EERAGDGGGGVPAVAPVLAGQLHAELAERAPLREAERCRPPVGVAAVAEPGHYCMAEKILLRDPDSEGRLIARAAESELGARAPPVAGRHPEHDPAVWSAHGVDVDLSEGPERAEVALGFRGARGVVAGAGVEQQLAADDVRTGDPVQRVAEPVPPPVCLGRVEHVAAADHYVGDEPAAVTIG